MKKITITAMLFACLALSQSVLANTEVKLKKSCLKEYPLVVGVTDPFLLTIYSEVCGSKNKETNSVLLSKAAERFQQMGLYYHTLEIVSGLELQGFTNSTLTDAKFLASANLAKNALIQMSENEVRFLTEDKTYPIALGLKVEIEKNRPVRILPPPVVETPKILTPKNWTPKVKTPKVGTQQGKTPKVGTQQGKTPKVGTQQGKTPKVGTQQGGTQKGETPIQKRNPTPFDSMNK